MRSVETKQVLSMNTNMLQNVFFFSWCIQPYSEHGQADDVPVDETQVWCVRLRD